MGVSGDTINALLTAMEAGQKGLRHDAFDKKAATILSDLKRGMNSQTDKAQVDALFASGKQVGEKPHEVVLQLLSLVNHSRGLSRESDKKLGLS
jgi:hypothetical protein